MKRSSLLLFSFLAIEIFAMPAFGAACCGGGFAAPSIISGDDKAQVSSSYSYTEVSVDNVDTSGVWRKWDQHQKIQSFRLEGAHIFSDRWQAGFAVPIIQRSRLGETYSGLGDVSTSIGYEYLPDWDYHPYRPKGLGFIQLTLPTGLAKAESEVGGLDSRGNGFLALGIGTLLTKAIGKWDGFSSFEIHRSFPKKVSNSQLQGELKPGYGGNLGLGAGYNLREFRFGSAITWTYEDAVEINGSFNSPGSIERYATGTFSTSYMPNDLWSGTLSYSDQTIFGSPVNTSLGKTAMLLLQRRWGR